MPGNQPGKISLNKGNFIMNIDQLFPSRYLKAADFPSPRNLTIKALTVEEIGDEQTRKPVLYFFEVSQGLVLNKTNLALVGAGYGKETDGWLNHHVELSAQPVSFQGKIVSGIRVRPAQPVYAQPAAPQKPPAIPPQPVAAAPMAPQQPAQAAPQLAAQQPAVAPVQTTQAQPGFSDLETDIDY